ncbi:arginyl-tRNA--protein transferase 1-like [Artemia franciscana]|uniref:Arginyl-tRNA--protein transferase 1 n=1 Tax=Artemia franciscana TaxID=6661 RepID=A0AA88IB75_ARTSF|nr:hypothetical protein QYM36_008352 [Artemia franciscana]
MDVTCCPQYTIRCLSTEIQLRKSHKKILKRMRNFLACGERPKTIGQFSFLTPEDQEIFTVSKQARLLETDLQNLNERKEEDETAYKKHKHDSILSGETVSELSEKPPKSIDATEKAGCSKKAKQKRIARKIESLKKKGVDFVPRPKAQQVQKKMRDYFEDEERIQKKHILKISLVQSSPASMEFQETLPESHALYAKYQMAVHGDKPSDCTMKHFERFLVKSPLKPVKGSDESLRMCGSYHQHYRLDGKLIAVGVIDILPRCVSSVYFYYDTEYQFLSLGTYGSLRELAFTQNLSKVIPDIKWYYLGFYIHDCPKMKYKGQYSPSFLLCPETKTWLPIEKCVPILDKTKYARLNPDLNAMDEEENVDLNEVLVLYERTMMNYAEYRSICVDANDESEVKEYAKLVGSSVANRMLLFRE